MADMFNGCGSWVEVGRLLRKRLVLIVSVELRDVKVSKSQALRRVVVSHV